MSQPYRPKVSCIIRYYDGETCEASFAIAGLQNILTHIKIYHKHPYTVCHVNNARPLWLGWLSGH